MIRHLDDKNEIEGYERSGVRVFKRQGSLRGPGKVEVDGHTLQGERIVIATGSEANIPPIEGLAGVGYWSNPPTGCSPARTRASASCCSRRSAPTGSTSGSAPPSRR
jgi:hypothetical protein